MGRAIQETRRTAQLSQPARVQPATTQSEDSGGRMRVPNYQTRPLVGQLSVMHLKTHETQPEPIPLTFPTKY